MINSKDLQKILQCAPTCICGKPLPWQLVDGEPTTHVCSCNRNYEIANGMISTRDGSVGSCHKIPEA